MGRVVLSLLLCSLLLCGCRNPHAHIDRAELRYQNAVDRYEQDCPASATAGNEEKTRECQAEHEDVEKAFQQLQVEKTH